MPVRNRANGCSWQHARCPDERSCLADYAAAMRAYWIQYARFGFHLNAAGRRDWFRRAIQKKALSSVDREFVQLPHQTEKMAPAAA
jgi:hypothetical protein